MNIVAVCACPTGVAHTYMAKKALEKAAVKRGHTIKVEAQGALGIENEITQEEVNNADIVILAVEVGIAKRERFEGKPKINIPVQMAVKSPDKIIEKLEEKLKK